jgi:hypothetical protein
MMKHLLALLLSAASAGDGALDRAATAAADLPASIDESLGNGDGCSVDEAPRLEAPPQYATDDFCTDPFAALCPEDPKWSTDSYKARREAAASRIAVQAYDATAALFGTGWELLPEPNVGPRAVFRNEMRKAISAEAFKAEFEAVFPRIQEVKDGLIRELALETDGILAEGPRTFLEGLVEGTVVLSSINVSTALLAGGAENQMLYAKYLMACGLDELAENAFNTSYRSQDIVYLCPGLFLSNPWEKPTRGAVIGVLAHELAHSIDHDSAGVAIYDDFLTCLDVHHGLSVTPQRNELTADYWMVRVLARTLQNDFGDYDQNLLFLRETYQAFCADPAGPRHPSGRQRIEILLRRDPEISWLMGCAPPVQAGAKHGCTLAGPTAEPIF